MRSALLLVVGACFWQLSEPTKTKEPVRIVFKQAPSTFTTVKQGPTLKLHSRRQKAIAAHPFESFPYHAAVDEPSTYPVDPRSSHRPNDMVTARQTGSVLLGPVRLALFLALMPLRLVLGWLALLGETLVALCRALPQALALIWRAALLAGMYCEALDECVLALAVATTSRCSFSTFLLYLLYAAGSAIVFAVLVNFTDTRSPIAAFAQHFKHLACAGRHLAVSLPWSMFDGVTDKQLSK
jgi:hypothetical protein